MEFLSKIPIKKIIIALVLALGLDALLDLGNFSGRNSIGIYGLVFLYMIFFTILILYDYRKTKNRNKLTGLLLIAIFILLIFGLFLTLHGTHYLQLLISYFTRGY